MNAVCLNLLLLPGYERCPKCLAQIHQDLLSCPNCLMLAQAQHDHTVGNHERHMQPAREGQTMLFNVKPEYPA